MSYITVNRKQKDLGFWVSEHAEIRMNQRSIKKGTVEAVLKFGRVIRSRGACFYVMGKRDSSHLLSLGFDVKRFENTQVVVDEKTLTVVTVYKNNNFRKIRPFRHRERKLH